MLVFQILSTSRKQIRWCSGHKASTQGKLTTFISNLLTGILIKKEARETHNTFYCYQLGLPVHEKMASSVLLRRNGTSCSNAQKIKHRLQSLIGRKNYTPAQWHEPITVRTNDNKNKILLSLLVLPTCSAILHGSANSYFVQAKGGS